MPLQRLPLYIDPIRMADTATQLKGVLSLQEMDRLANSVGTKSKEVAIVIEFGIDIEGLRFMRGSVTGQIELICQRCLKPFIFTIDSGFLLSPVKNDTEAKELPAQYEPLLLTEEMLLVPIFEDELLLSLPLIPMHPPEVCSVKLDDTKKKTRIEKSNLFSQLAKLKIKKPKS